MKKLKTKLEELLATYTGQWGVVICQQGTGEKIEINPEMVFPAASMIKVPIMYEIMCQVANGLIDLDGFLTVSKEKRVGGAGILQELRPEIAMTVRELVTLMIILSDNTATNLLIELVGMEAVNQRMQSLGLRSTLLCRKMMDFEAARAGKENKTSARDLALLFHCIQQSEGLPPEYGALMLDILKRQQVVDKLPFYLPEDRILAHKTGTLSGVEHDGGILYLPQDSYVICILTMDLRENYQGLQLVASMGKIIYDYFNSRRSYYVL